MTHRSTSAPHMRIAILLATVLLALPLALAGEASANEEGFRITEGDDFSLQLNFFAEIDFTSVQEEQEFSGRTIEEGLASRLVWLMAPNWARGRCSSERGDGSARLRRRDPVSVQPTLTPRHSPWRLVPTPPARGSGARCHGYRASPCSAVSPVRLGRTN